METTRVNGQIRIDSWLTEGDERTLADDVLDGLTKPFKELPPKHFYDTRGSELFDQICELPEYYPTRTERAILETHAADIVAADRTEELRRARLRLRDEDARAARCDGRGGHAAPLRARSTWPSRSCARPPRT